MFHCSSEQNPKIDFKITPKSYGEKIELTLNFISTRKQSILIDWDALSIYNPSFEKDKL